MISFTRIKKREVIFLIFIIGLTSSCTESFIKNKEARDDIEEYTASVAAQKTILQIFYPRIETSPVASAAITDDSADDPAIWYNESDPSMSVIYGSNKIAGIHSYDLNGHELQFMPIGEINNVDVRQNVRFGGAIVDILGGSNRSDNSIDLYSIDLQGRLDSTHLGKIQLGAFEPYGFCLGKSADHLLHIYVNDKNGYVHHYAINSRGDLSKRRKRTLKFRTQIEGMVVDDQTGELYIGEEQKGIWLCDAFDIQSQRKEFILESEDSNPNIRYDIEGLALLPPHFLVASSQGNFSYAIFDRMTKSYLTSFKIDQATPIDGVEETDGIEIMALQLSPQFDKGILVVQDGFNYQDSVLIRQNFKFVELGPIMDLVLSEKRITK